MNMTVLSWKRILVGVVVLAGTFVGVIWLLTRLLAEREASCQGEPVESWIEQLNSPDVAVSNRAAVVVNTMIIAQLTEQMFHDTNDSSLRIALIEKLNDLPGVSLQFATAPFRRAAAARLLGEIG